MFWHTQTILLATLWSILHQSRPANVLVDDNDNGVAAEQCRSSLIWRRLLPATAGPGSFRWNGAAPIGTTTFDDDEAWKVYESMESCGAAWVGSSDWANHLQSQVQETMQRRKERFLVCRWRRLAGNQHVQIQQIWIHWIPSCLLCFD